MNNAVGERTEAHLKNRRLGLALAALALSYIGAVITFLLFK